MRHRNSLLGHEKLLSTVIDLVYYHEKSVDEVAHILCVPPATVKTRMFYARKKLAGLVEGG
jgi:RNA polymerase sigma-70 factor, ECF subfamily